MNRKHPHPLKWTNVPIIIKRMWKHLNNPNIESNYSPKYRFMQRQFNKDFSSREVAFLKVSLMKIL